MNDIPMKDYYSLLEEIMVYGIPSDDRTGVGTVALFGKQLRFDLSKGFPLLPGKFTPFNLVAAELLWFLAGSSNVEYLRELNGNGRETIWEEWAEKGVVGPMYGHQWRNWSNVTEGKFAVDQIKNLIQGLKERPNSRRHVISAWNVADLPDESVNPRQNVLNGKMALAPCHYSFQMNVSDGKLSCMVNMRSSDTFLGLPFNIASYALLTHMIAHVTGLLVGELIFSLGDAHIYNNHLTQVSELLDRDHSKFSLSTLYFKRKINSIDDFTMNDLGVIDYKSYSSIKAPIAI